jgi:phage terminase large subunit
MGGERRLRILCAREFQNSIADSVHRVLSDQIVLMGLDDLYTVQKATIQGVNGTEFIFAGLRHNTTSLKSLEGVDICWVEEAEAVSEESWQVLDPTIRKPGSEIWVTFNPGQETDPTYQRFVVRKRDDAIVVKVGWKGQPVAAGSAAQAGRGHAAHGSGGV